MDAERRHQLRASELRPREEQLERLLSESQDQKTALTVFCVPPLSYKCHKRKHRMYLGSVAWTLSYDTIYAHQDKADDAKVGPHTLRFREGLAFKAHRLVCHTTLGFRVIKEEEEGR